MNLIVVESPTKARTLSRFLGKDFTLEATMGHIKDLPKSKLGVDVEHDFEPKYLILKNKSKSIKKIREQAKKTEEVYLATDPDREGEAIAQHVHEVLHSTKKQKNKIQRIVFHEITKRAVEEAIKHPRGIDQNLVDAQIARRVLDRLVGYKLSPLLWKKVRRGLSAGRVQSVTVRLIVEREREIKAFKPEEYWEIYCEVSRVTRVPRVQREEKLKASDTSGTLDSRDTFLIKLVKIDDKKAGIEDGETAKTVVFGLQSAKYKIADVKKREVSKNPYPPFTTSTVTQGAARAFFWSARRTMGIAQRLYEQGLITYHRTDSTNVAKTAIKNVRGFIKKEYGVQYLPKQVRIYKTKAKVAQEAHEAIRPTKVGVTNDKFQMTNGLANDHKKLYTLIWRRFVACQMAASIYDETRIDVMAQADKIRTSEVTERDSSDGGKERVYTLRASGQILKFDGWRVLYNGDRNSEAKLPDVKKGESLQLIKVDPQQNFTQPPSRYGEASLIKTLEKLGIGRPSTYAPTISTIQTRNYVEKKEGKFLPTPIGFTVNDFLIKHFLKIFDYKFTARMEDDLDSIANGKRKWATMMKDFYSPFEVKLEKVTEEAKRVKIATEKLGKKCPKCKKGELVVRIGRFGKFISCSRFPDCDHKEKYIEKIGVKCPDCGKGDVIIKTTKKKRRFYGCSRYPDCKWASWRKPKG